MREQLENLRDTMYCMQQAAIDGDWELVETLDQQRTSVLDRLRQCIAPADTSDYSRIISEVIQLDKNIMQETGSHLDTIAAKIAQDNEFNKVRAHYQQQL